jgi:hypothetical protein
MYSFSFEFFAAVQHARRVRYPVPKTDGVIEVKIETCSFPNSLAEIEVRGQPGALRAAASSRRAIRWRS